MTVLTRALAWRWTRWVVGTIAIAVVLALFLWLARKQVPRTLFDSPAYLEAASKPLSWQQLFYPKPPVVSLIYRLASSNVTTIVTLQRVICFASWTCLGIVLVSFLRQRAVRIAAGVITALFVLAPARIGYTDVILSESINDSLLALCIAALLAITMLRGPRQLVAATVLVIATVMWTLARDSNAVVVIVAALFAVCTNARMLWRTRWGIGVVVVPLMAAGIALWSVDVTRKPDPFNSVQPNWPTDFTSRGTWSKLNNVFDRVLPDADAREYFREHGLVQADRLATVAERSAVVYDPELAPSRIWIAEKSRGVFLRWLVRHPIERVTDQVRYAWTLLGVDSQNWYMPRGWKGYSRSKLVHWVFDLTTNRVVLVALLLLCPFALWRTWHHAGRNIALGLIVSGWLGSLAAFYADSSEYGRHCFGSGQQVIFGLCLAMLLLLDSGVRRGRVASRVEPNS